MIKQKQKWKASNLHINYYTISLAISCLRVDYLLIAQHTHQLINFPLNKYQLESKMLLFIYSAQMF